MGPGTSSVGDHHDGDWIASGDVQRDGSTRANRFVIGMGCHDHDVTTARLPRPRSSGP